MDGLIFSLQNILANSISLGGKISNLYNPSGAFHINIVDPIKYNFKFTKEYFISNLYLFYTKEEFIRDNLNIRKNEKNLENFLNQCVNKTDSTSNRSFLDN